MIDYSKMPEVWVSIKDYQGYEVSSYGNVRSIERRIYYENLNQWKVHRGYLLKLGNTKQGYKKLIFRKAGKPISFLVHRIVAIHFIPNPNNYLFVNHLKGNKFDNRCWMLEWCTRSMNVKHSFEVLKRKPSVPGLGRFGSNSLCAIPIIQKDKEGNEIKRFGSIIEAANELKMYASSIGTCLSGRTKTSGGFKWEKADKIIKINNK